MKKIFIILISLCLFALNLPAQIVDSSPEENTLECGTDKTITRILVFKSTATSLEEAIIHSRRWSVYIARYLNRNPSRLNYQFECESCKGENDGCTKRSAYISSDHLNPRNLDGTWFVVIELVFQAGCTPCEKSPWPALDSEEGLKAIGLSMTQLKVNMSYPLGSSDILLNFDGPNGNNLDLFITDISGRTIRKETFSASENSQYSINTSGIEQGKYFISVIGNQEIWTKPIDVK